MITFLWYSGDSVTTKSCTCHESTAVIASAKLSSDYLPPSHAPLDMACPLQWHHDECDGVLNHRRLDCFPNHLFRRRSKKTSKLRVTGFVRGIHRSPVISPHKWKERGKCFHDVVMYTECILRSMVHVIYGHSSQYGGCWWPNPWWCHQMETFSALLALCAGTGEFPAQRPMTRSFDVFFDWVNNREAGDLRRHRADYDVIVMAYLADAHLRQSCFVTYNSFMRLQIYIHLFIHFLCIYHRKCMLSPV